MKVLLSLSKLLQEKMPVHLIHEIIGKSIPVAVSDDTVEDMLSTAKNADVVLTFRLSMEYIENALI